LSEDRGPEARARATIKILFSDEGTARAIWTAISPDNFQTPAGITVSTKITGGKLTASIACLRGVKTLIATIDDLLSCIQSAERAIGGVSS
jgi:hypothetical protein